MELNGNRLVQANVDQAWQGINDPEIIRACVPGCESVEKLSETEYTLVVSVALGPVKARFNGKLYLDQLNPPHTYRLKFEGQGGAVGFVKGTADVTLLAAGLNTELTYRVTSQIGGKLAQLGSRLIDGTAKKLAEEFFANLNNALNSSEVAANSMNASDSNRIHRRSAGISAFWYASAALFSLFAACYFLLK